MTQQRIAEKVAVRRQTVTKLLRPDRAESHAIKRTNNRLHTTIHGVYGRFKVKKRPHPGRCELCERDKSSGGKVLKLSWHHWDDDHPEQGVWLCRSCHQFAEIVDWKGIERVHKYLGLKLDYGGNHHE